jgi:hypothetical protein
MNKLSCCKPPNGLHALIGLSLDTREYWGKGGPHLRVSFCEPTPMPTQARAVRWMNQWARWCNCSFTLAPGNGQVRITLVPGQGNWTIPGPQCLAVPAPQPTMWIDGGIKTPADVDCYGGSFLHETGHILGFEHESQRPDFLAMVVPSDVLAQYRSWGWTDADTEQYILAPLSAQYVQMSPGGADFESIMALYFSPNVTVNGRAIGGASTLSARDKRMAAIWYPLPK